MTRYSRTPANRRIKYLAYGSIAITIILLITMLLFHNTLSDRALLILRGTAGLFAIIFVVLYAILLLRVNTTYWHHRNP